MRLPRHPLARTALGIPATAYAIAIRLRNRRYDRGGHTARAPVPVLSVGNMTVGGTGKTPLVAWLAEQLTALGRRPAIVSRGYGGRAGRGPLVVSCGAGPGCGPDVCGDEPYLLASRLEGSVVVVGSDRIAAAEAAARAGADVVVLDDGFQHRRLARDLDLVLLDRSDPFGNERLLPAGTLREPVAGLGRADIVLITRSRPAERAPAIEQVVRRHNDRAPILYAGHRALGFFTAGGREVARPRAAVVFCGIGNPGRFRSDLEELGVEIAAFEAYRDHHRYQRAELGRLSGEAARRGVALVTTEKDLARLAADARAAGLPAAPLALRIEAEPFAPELLLAAIERALGKTA